MARQTDVLWQQTWQQPIQSAMFRGAQLTLSDVVTVERIWSELLTAAGKTDIKLIVQQRRMHHLAGHQRH